MSGQRYGFIDWQTRPIEWHRYQGFKKGIIILSVFYLAL